MGDKNGEEKLIAMARHIAKTLGQTDTMADDILQIFSNFDNRFRNKLSDPPDQALKALHRQISPFLSSDRPIWSHSDLAASFLNSLDDLISLYDNHPHCSSSSATAADDLLHLSMCRLEQEFNTLMHIGSDSFDSLENNSDDDGHVHDHDDPDIPVANPVTDFDIIIDALPSGTISDLNAIAKRMVAARYAQECCHVYGTCRMEFLDESLSRLGFRRLLSIEDVQKMAWPEVEDEIELWSTAVVVSLRILFPSERRLCDRVFFGLPAVADLAFMEACKGPADQVLNFADAVAIGSRAPERLFKVLDVYETIRDLIPEFDSVFSDQYCIFLRNKAVSIWKRLGEAIRGIFMELENLIRRDPAKAAVPGGGLHPITRYVMNYLRAVCRSRQTLDQVFEDSMHAAPGVGPLNSLNSSSLLMQMAWIMEVLESNLETKSKIYNDPALCSVFMMNNARYIIQKVRDSELGSLLGDDWIRKHVAKVRQYRANYQRSSWNKALGFLKLESSTLAPNGGSRDMKEKLKAFNACFDEICKAQSEWLIFDEQIKEELKISAVGNLSPPYRAFLGRFLSFPDIGRNERHIKYTVEELEARIHNLFQGGPGSANGRK